MYCLFFKTPLYISLILLVFSLINFKAHSQETEPSIKVGFHRSVPIALDRNSITWTGFYGKIYQCMFDNLDGNVSFQSLPVRRMVKMLEAGKLDVGVLLARTDLRDGHSSFVGPLIEHPYLLLTQKQTPVSDNEDWSQWTLGTVYGTNFHYMLDNFTKAKIETSSSWDSITNMLKLGRVKGVVIAREIVEKNISVELLEGLKSTELTNLPTMKIGLYVSNQSKKNEKLMPQFSQALTKCDGFLKKYDVESAK